MGIELKKASVPTGLRVYAVGDVHGCLNELQAMLSLIKRDLSQNSTDQYKLIFTGDYMDRGPRSKGVLSLLMMLMDRDPNVICLCGNHDLALLKFMSDPFKYGPLFFKNGGTRTLRSFGVRVIPGVISDEHMHEIHAFSRLIVNPLHLAFLSGLPTSKTIGDYFFCHAGIRPGVALKKQSIADLTFIRDDFLDDTTLHEKVIVHGHTARDEVDVQNNRINVDTRCHASGVLSCLVLEGSEHRFLQTKAGK